MYAFLIVISGNLLDIFPILKEKGGTFRSHNFDNKCLSDCNAWSFSERFLNIVRDRRCGKCQEDLLSEFCLDFVIWRENVLLIVISGNLLGEMPICKEVGGIN